jgi:hypothetical protein
MARSTQRTTRRTPSKFARAIAARPSTADGPGWIYFWTEYNRRLRRWILKLSMMTRPGKRRRQWDRKCKSEKHLWYDWVWHVQERRKFGECFFILFSFVLFFARF